MQISLMVSRRQLIELQEYIKLYLPSARFMHNPQRLSEERWNVTLTLEYREDIERFNALLNSWQQEEAQPKEARTLYQRVTEFIADWLF